MHLRDIVADVFVVHQIPVRIGGFIVPKSFSYIRLSGEVSTA